MLSFRLSREHNRHTPSWLTVFVEHGAHLTHAPRTSLLRLIAIKKSRLGSGTYESWVVILAHDN